MDLHILGWNPILDQHFEVYLSQGFHPARITREERHGYLTLSEKGEHWAELAGRIRHHAADRSALPVVGDWVALKRGSDNDGATIQGVLPRKSKFSRKVVWKRKVS